MPLSAARALPCGARYALYFNGIDNYVDVYNAPSLNPRKELTVSAWIYPTGYPTWTTQIVDKSTNQFRFCFDGYGSYIIFEVYTTDGLRSFRRPWGKKIYEWHYVVATYSSLISKIRIYDNDSLLGEATWSGDLAATANIVRIGNYYAGLLNPFQGIIAGVLIYSRALSDKELAWNFNHRDNPVRNGLVLWLHWASIDIDAGKWYDKTIYGNHGTIHGATLIEPIRLKARTLSPVRTLSPAR